MKEVFRLTPSTVSSLTGELRSHAAGLTPICAPELPALGPVRGFAEAFAAAIGSVNDRTSELRAETERIASVMDTTVAATQSVDGQLARGLEVVNP